MDAIKKSDLFKSIAEYFGKTGAEFVNSNTINGSKTAYVQAFVVASETFNKAADTLTTLDASNNKEAVDKFRDLAMAVMAVMAVTVTAQTNGKGYIDGGSLYRNENQELLIKAEDAFMALSATTVAKETSTSDEFKSIAGGFKGQKVSSGSPDWVIDLFRRAEVAFTKISKTIKE